MTQQAKRAFKYRSHPTDEQAAELSRSAFTWRDGRLTLAKMTGPLGVRERRCGCGAVHDRDVNAARNILAAGPAVSACGDGVRPQRESSRTSRSSVKQETQRVTAGIPHL